LLPSDTVDPDQSEKRPTSVGFWAQYGLTQNNLRTAGKALERALAVLEMRCDLAPLLSGMDCAAAPSAY
jgi:hypothetical protein